ncbi:hypothetical protein HYV22_01255 [Candidatus Gottesmanbacteria bacterium]|nr:hypothetical protein [Candidatus Gottesmanbacteria bacterium]
MKKIRESMTRRLKRWNRHFSLSKRQQFVGITAILTIGLLLTQLVSTELRYTMVLFLAAAAYILSAFSLRDDLSGIEWMTLLVLPTAYTAAIALFYFLLPVRWLTRIPVAAFYAVGMYALLLTENIYNVAAERTIALLRAAHSVGFLLTLVTYFLLLQTILSFHFYAPVSVVATGMVSFFLAFQFLWAIELESRVNQRLVHVSVLLSVVFAQLAWVFSFWPVSQVLQALFITTCFYSMVGMAQQYLVERLYKKIVIEFMMVTVLVFIIVFLATHWRGNF